MSIFGIPGTALMSALSVVAKEIIPKVKSALSPTELEKIIKEAIQAAQQEEEKRLENGLFHVCDPHRQTEPFLVQVIQDLAVQKELEKPLTGKYPDIQNLTEAFKRLAKSKNVPIKEVGLEPWLDKFIHTYFQKSPAYPSYQATKQNYLDKILIDSKRIYFVGINVRGNEEERSEELDNIFVIPDLLEEAKKGKNLLTQADRLLEDDRFRKIVILGEPGSGKSTLMQFFAANIAQHKIPKLPDSLPILIRIRDLAKNAEIDILSYLQEVVPKKYSLKDMPEDFFDYWLKRGRAILLIDGLDEISDEKKRHEVVQRLYFFIKNVSYAKNRVIITSRPAEYKRDFFKTEEYPHYYIQPFDENKINSFIDKWHNTRFLDPDESERWKTSLRTVLNQQERINLLVQNPLLLTLVCLIHRYDVYRLPQKRHNLYEKALETLLTSWESNKTENIYQQLQYIKSEADLRRLMEKLAYWIHSQESKKDINSSTIVERNEIIDQLSKDIKKLKKIELYQAKKEAERFIEYISARSGLLNEQGQECYAFVHKTFQEYLCAKEIQYRREDDDDFNILLQHIEDHIYDPHWREVLLLLIVIQRPKPIAKAINTILDYDKNDQKRVYHNLLFAASCLAEDPQGLITDENDPSSKILSGLVQIEINPDLDKEMRSQIFSSFCSLSKTDFAKSALKILEENQAHIDEDRMRDYRTRLST